MMADDPNQAQFKTGNALIDAVEKNTDPRDLKPFADQLMLIAQHLRDGKLSGSSATAEDEGGTLEKPPSPLTRQDFAAMARNAYAMRRRRTAIFGNPELFGEPAWDILLDLYIALTEKKPVSVSSACIGSASPPTTGLRWLGILADHGLVQREQDPEDQRRVLVRLTEKGAQAMEQYFASIAQR